MPGIESISDIPGLALLNAIPQPALVFTPDLIIIAQNRAHQIATGTAFEDIRSVSLFDAFPAPGGEGALSAEVALRRSVAQVCATGEADSPPVQGHGLQGEAGEWQVHYWQMTHSPIFQDGRVAYILQLSEDVSENVLAQAFTDAERVAHRSAAALSAFTLEPVTGAFDRAAGVDELFGFHDGSAGPNFEPFFARILDEDAPHVQAVLNRVFEHPDRRLAEFDCRVVLPETGEIRFIRARGEMALDPRDKRRKLVGVFTDMTDLMSTREALEQAVRDKEALLVEVNHRVKNSLQLVSSVMRMQAKQSKHPELKAGLEVATSRVRAIAEVHRNLYVGGDVESVRIDRLLTSLVEAYNHTVGDQTGNAGPVGLKSCEFKLPTDLAIGFGLLVNELVTNALKYSDVTEPETRIMIECAKREGDIILDITNPIRSAQPPIEVTSTGVGSRLVSGFVRQLGADLTTEERDGRFRASVKFPAKG